MQPFCLDRPTSGRQKDEGSPGHHQTHAINCGTRQAGKGASFRILADARPRSTEAAPTHAAPLSQSVRGCPLQTRAGGHATSRDVRPRVSRGKCVGASRAIRIALAPRETPIFLERVRISKRRSLCCHYLRSNECMIPRSRTFLRSRDLQLDRKFHTILTCIVKLAIRRLR